jgi:hypothetical protein
MVHNVLVWALAPLAYPGLVLCAAFAVGAGALIPVAPALLPIWTTNVAFGVWLYWEGFKINVASSTHPGRVWERYAVLILIPFFAFLECLAITRALLRLATFRQVSFVVIAKPL